MDRSNGYEGIAPEFLAGAAEAVDRDRREPGAQVGRNATIGSQQQFRFVTSLRRDDYQIPNDQDAEAASAAT